MRKNEARGSYGEGGSVNVRYNADENGGLNRAEGVAVYRKRRAGDPETSKPSVSMKTRANSNSSEPVRGASKGSVPVQLKTNEKKLSLEDERKARVAEARRLAEEDVLRKRMQAEVIREREKEKRLQRKAMYTVSAPEESGKDAKVKEGKELSREALKQSTSVLEKESGKSVASASAGQGVKFVSAATAKQVLRVFVCACLFVAICGCVGRNVKLVSDVSKEQVLCVFVCVCACLCVRIELGVKIVSAATVE
jgi:hypothetical protein